MIVSLHVLSLHGFAWIYTDCHIYDLFIFLVFCFFLLYVLCSVCLYSFQYRTMNIDALAMIWCILPKL